MRWTDREAEDAVIRAMHACELSGKRLAAIGKERGLLGLGDADPVCDFLYEDAGGVVAVVVRQQLAPLDAETAGFEQLASSAAVRRIEIYVDDRPSAVPPDVRFDPANGQLWKRDGDGFVPWLIGKRELEVRVIRAALSPPRDPGSLN